MGKKNLSRPHRPMRAALYQTLFWVSCALIFNVLLWFYFKYSTNTAYANQKALEFLTGYVIEKTLSVDNLFVFYLIFHHFHIPTHLQKRVFKYGIWSAMIMRLGIILLGVWLVTRFHWLLYVMGAFLILTGIRMCFAQEKEKDLADTLIIKLTRKFFRITSALDGERFFIKKNHLWYATPLFLTLIFIEVSDLIFAMDSIPAIFAITTDPLIIWTSNIFAILGLRSLYFILAGMVEKFRLLKYGIAIILMFVGLKMVIEPWLNVPTSISLFVIFSILILFSWISFSQYERK